MKELCLILAVMVIGIIMGMVWMAYLGEDERKELSLSKDRESMLRHQVENLERVLDRSVKSFDELKDLMKNAPEDCKMGPWCQGCQYAKEYVRYLGHNHGSVDAVYCGKNEACQHFAQREDE